MATLTKIPVITREYYRVPVTITVAGAVIDPTGLTVEFALVAVGVDPVNTDWKAGLWETIPGPPVVYLALAFVGDSTTDFPLTLGVTNDLWWRVTDTPERPARLAGQIQGT